MGNLLKVRPTILQSGERFPFIVSETGMPQYYPNIFLVSDLRKANSQYNTLLSAAGGIKILRLWELIADIDIVKRMINGTFLDNCEVDSLADALWQTSDHLNHRIEQAQSKTLPKKKMTNLAEYRRMHNLADKKEEFVKAGSFAARAVYVIKYLKCLGNFAINAEVDEVKKRCLRRELNEITRSIGVRIPERFFSCCDAEYQRLGLTQEVQGLLREVIVAGHAFNHRSKASLISSRVSPLKQGRKRVLTLLKNLSIFPFPWGV
jgi:hypothetical protein